MAITMPQLKPLLTGEEAEKLKFWKRINLTYWLQRAPMFLLSLPAAYGVAAFAHVHLPAPFNWFAGAGFESVYLGAVALADQMYEDNKYTTGLWWLLNIIAVSMSALVNVLFFSGNTFAGITTESYVHGIPLPLLSFGYSLLLHQVTNSKLIADKKKQKEADDLAKQTAFKCKFCGEGKATMNAVYGHYKNCDLRTTHLKTPGKHTCNCLQCNPV